MIMLRPSKRGGGSFVFFSPRIARYIYMAFLEMQQRLS